MTGVRRWSRALPPDSPLAWILVGLLLVCGGLMLAWRERREGLEVMRLLDEVSARMRAPRPPKFTR